MEIDFSKLKPQELRDIFGNTFGGGTTNSGAGNNTSAGNDTSSGNYFLDAITSGLLKSLGNNTYTPLSTDPTFSSGLNYAQSIAGGQNVPGMIAPGVSYSSASPGGYTAFGGVEAPVQTPIIPPSFGTPPSVQPPINFPPINIGGPVEPPINIGGPVTSPIQVPPPVFIDPPVGGPVGGPIPDPIFPPVTDPIIPPMPPINIGGPVGGPVPDPIIPPPSIGGPGGGNPINTFPIGTGGIREKRIDPPINIGAPVDSPIPDPVMPPINIGAPVELPGMGGPSMFPIPPISIGGVGGGIDFDDYVVPQVPLNNLLNQNPPQGPVGMSPQETAKVSSQQELLNLISNKDVLSQIPADDGVRNKYQVELDEYINESPINMDTYKETLPVGSAINLGIPAVMETVVPMAVPGLSLAKNISNSFSSNNNPSPSPRPSSPSVSRPSTSRPNYSHSQVRRFGR